MFFLLFGLTFSKTNVHTTAHAFHSHLFHVGSLIYSFGHFFVLNSPKWSMHEYWNISVRPFVCISAHLMNRFFFSTLRILFAVFVSYSKYHLCIFIFIFHICVEKDNVKWQMKIEILKWSRPHHSVMISMNHLVQNCWPHLLTQLVDIEPKEIF